MRSRLLATAFALAATSTLLFAGAAAAEAPQMNTPASISGTAAVGHELTAHNGTWLYDNGLSCKSECEMSYQWQRCAASGGSCTDIGGAGTRFYTVQGADAGSRLRVMETMSIYDCGAGDSQTGVVPCRWDRRTAPSGQTSIVPGSAPTAPTAPTPPAAPAVPAPQAPIAPTATAAPTVAGLAMVDEILTATKGTWSGSPLLTLEWLRCDAVGQNCAGLGVTSDTYRVIPFDVGKTLRVRVTGVNVAGFRSALSDATPLVSELKPTDAKPAIEVSKVHAPHKLVISELGARPARVVRRGAVTVRFTVLDSRGFRVSGALVKAVVLPRHSFAVPSVATSADDGSVTLVFSPGPKLDLRRLKAVTIVVTALRPGDRPTSPRASVVRVKLGVVKRKTGKR